MNTKKIIAATFALLMVVGFSSCKPKQSAYKAAYERAMQREVAQAEQNQDTVEPVITSSDDTAVRSERVNVAEGEDANGLRAYSVVIGAFENPTNARALKERMQGEGYSSALLAQNEKGMYRVIVTSFDTKDEAVRSREQIKNRFAPLFADAWILQREY